MKKYLFTCLFLLGMLVAGAQSKVQTDSIAEDMLLFQRTTGGWPKHIPFRGKKEIKVNYRRLNLTDQEREILRADSNRMDATYDNYATFKEITYLVKAFQHTQNPAYLKAAEKGIVYILAGQYQDTGGWPQFYPLRGGYPDHITYNDNAMINNLIILQQVVDGSNGFNVVNQDFVEPAKKAVRKGIECILKTQVVVEGKLTVWCAQHDEKTLLPAKARAYELESLSGQESVGVIQFLMSIKNPSDSVVRAIQGAMKWIDDNKIEGYTTKFIKVEGRSRDYDRIFVAEAGAVTWARFYDLETGKPFFCGRDGIKKSAMNEIEYERRAGYGWYGEWPKNLLEKEYPAWKERMGMK